MVGVIDVMNYAPLIAPGLTGPEFRFKEFQIMFATTFKSMAAGGTVQTFWGREVPVDGSCEEDRTLKVDEAIARMDENGYEISVVACLKMWSYYWHHQLIMDQPWEVVAQALQVNNERFIGGVGYNPFRIDQSIRDVETAVHEFGFKYANFHPITFGIAPNDARCYPLYAKCSELGIPVGFQVGHSAEVLPSDVGNPYTVDRIAIDFPDLKINMSHTGWPWTSEFCSVIWRHPNVYGDTSAYFPSTLDPELVRFFDSARGRNKIMFGTNGMDMGRCRTQLEELPISDRTKERVLYHNALEFFGL
jgi:predicted TIM-barrel fold metal-dependent hydrolase